MASTALIPVAEYLATSYKPACEYLEGVIRQKPMPTYKHGKMQLRVCELINAGKKGFEAIPEQTVRVREDRYLVPDVAVQSLSALQQPYPTLPIALCVEVLSPEDRFSEAVAKCEEYHMWGVPCCWLIDPERRLCWSYAAGQRPQQMSDADALAAQDIVVKVAELFAGF